MPTRIYALTDSFQGSQAPCASVQIIARTNKKHATRQSNNSCTHVSQSMAAPCQHNVTDIYNMQYIYIIYIYYIYIYVCRRRQPAHTTGTSTQANTLSEQRHRASQHRRCRIQHRHPVSKVRAAATFTLVFLSNPYSYRVCLFWFEVRNPIVTAI